MDCRLVDVGEGYVFLLAKARMPKPVVPKQRRRGRVPMVLGPVRLLLAAEFRA